MSAEEDLNESLGRWGQLVKDTAGATHSLSCGVLDRDSNKEKYLREALDMIDDTHRRTSWRGSASQETTEVILVERQQRDTSVPTHLGHSGRLTAHELIVRPPQKESD